MASALSSHTWVQRNYVSSVCCPVADSYSYGNDDNLDQVWDLSVLLVTFHQGDYFGQWQAASGQVAHRQE